MATDGGTAAYCAQLVADPASAAFLHPALQRWLPYLTIHATLARVRHLHPQAAIHTRAAEEGAFAHLNYALSWRLVWLTKPRNYILDGTGGAVIALGRGQNEVPPPPHMGLLLKLRGLDRTAFDCMRAYRAYARDSPLVEVFSMPSVPYMWPVRLLRYVAAWQARFGPTSDRFLLALFVVIHAVTSVMLALEECLDRPLGAGIAATGAAALLLVGLRFVRRKNLNLKLT